MVHGLVSLNVRGEAAATVPSICLLSSPIRILSITPAYAFAWSRHQAGHVAHLVK